MSTQTAIHLGIITADDPTGNRLIGALREDGIQVLTISAAAHDEIGSVLAKADPDIVLIVDHPGLPTRELLNTMTPPAGFRHATAVQVRWGDMDALGHVNNAVYLTYLEQARIAYTRNLEIWTGKLDSLGVILARVVLDYKLPLTNADTITVYTRVSRLGTKSFDMEQLIVRRDEAVAAAATFTIVVYDYATEQSAPIPSAWRAKYIDYEPALES